MILMLAPGIGRLLLSVTIPEMSFVQSQAAKNNVKKVNTLSLVYNLLV
jgi:hypothetical protein